MQPTWIADRTEHFDSSGIRKVFDLASQLTDPINLSIGQPDFDVPEPIKRAMISSVEQGRNAYSPTQGITPLRERLQADVDGSYGHADRKLFVCSGTSGGLVLALMASVNPGDEVIISDPCFVMYESLIRLAGGIPVRVNTYPTFELKLTDLEAAITSSTKAILVNSPGNPTGVVASREELKAIAELCHDKGLLLISDEIYREFCYDSEFVSPAEFNSETLVIDGFSKSYAMTGWRLGFAHGPADLIDAMLKIQQYTFVCAPQPVQWAGVAALDFDMTSYVQDYKKKRDLVVAKLDERFELTRPDGAFYAFPKAPMGSGYEFVQKAIAANVLIIPGNVFSTQDTHFRISYAAQDDVLEKGIEILNGLLD